MTTVLAGQWLCYFKIAVQPTSFGPKKKQIWIGLLKSLFFSHGTTLIYKGGSMWKDKTFEETDSNLMKQKKRERFFSSSLIEVEKRMVWLQSADGITCLYRSQRALVAYPYHLFSSCIKGLWEWPFPHTNYLFENVILINYYYIHATRRLRYQHSTPFPERASSLVCPWNFCTHKLFIWKFYIFHWLDI